MIDSESDTNNSNTKNSDKTAAETRVSEIEAPDINSPKTRAFDASTSAETLAKQPEASFRYYDLMMAAFVCVLLCSNIIAPAKTGIIYLPFSLPGLGNSLTFGVGNIFFPISYIIGDILTEVYGYSRARRAIWAGFAAMLFMSLMSFLIVNIPTNPNESYNSILQPAIEVVFGNTGRIIFASILAFWIGDFVNSFVLAKMKILTQGRWLWTRTIGSTIAGQGIDSLIFYPLAFAGIWQTDSLLQIMLFNFLFKLTVEVLMTPVTYLVINRVKKAENVDTFDINTNFTPFKLND